MVCSDLAYGGSLEATLREKGHPLGRSLSTPSLSNIDWHGDFSIQWSLLEGSQTWLDMSNLNNRRAGQANVCLNSSKRLQITLFGPIPLLRKQATWLSSRRTVWAIMKIRLDMLQHLCCNWRKLLKKPSLHGLQQMWVKWSCSFPLFTSQPFLSYSH